MAMASAPLENDPTGLAQRKCDDPDDDRCGLRGPTSGGGMLDLDGIRRQMALSMVTLRVASVGGHATARIIVAPDGLR
jgi:hypothetical protein